ncbi:MAG: valine--tRNA ligase [Chloroflexi bacterium]|nr:valine--tRNA ligase [Chloroflexota bacterium]
MASAQPKQDFPKAYVPSTVEERIYKLWMERGYFTPQIDPDRKPFVIIMPPPNVTGELHLGHALVAALQDALARWHRMLGEPVLWLPGTDHAGIATQVVVERELEREGLTRHDLGREQFVERVWEWVRKYGGVITGQQQRLGASCDWTRERFTLDPGPGAAVRTTFVSMYNRGLIYRGNRIINWCPRCATALSDLEVVHTEEQGKLYYIRYLYEKGDGSVTVATTRPETLLGDTAVAVNPKDKRYKRLAAGQRLVLPVLGRLLPVVADEAVDAAFGTGALKVTPGHDPTDFEIGQRHGLDTVNVMNLDGTLNEEAGPYQGYDRYRAREAIVEQLDREGLLERVEPYGMSIGHCSRCDTVVEPLVSEQWFVRMSPSEPPAKPAIDAVKEGRLRIVPERFTKVYLNWMENIRDWCISRQLWWGHRIPVWYCDECGGETVTVVDPNACSQCGSAGITQDPDVLDTWFSSALWPHSTLGWPEETDDLSYFYPGTVMETGYDILFFWVARMIMMGLQNTGEVPFHTVYLHGLIRDVQGVKMSKSRGNVIDPLQTVDLYGADALRFAITTGTTPGNDSRLGEAKLEAARNFANKLWNAGRFVIASLEDAKGLDGWSNLTPPEHREDRWILIRYNRLIERVNQFFAEFQLGEAERELYEFLWNEFCDWYIEMAKVRLRGGDVNARRVLAHVLEGTLRLLHPFMPFITEELWQRLTAVLPREGSLPDSIMIAPYPQQNPDLLDEEAETDIELVTNIVRAIRNVRAEFRIEPTKRLEARIESPATDGIVEGEREAIETLARIHLLKKSTDNSSSMVTLVVGTATVSLDVGDAVDLDTERRRLQGEVREADQHIRRLTDHLADEQFTGKAPEEVVERESQRLSSLKERQGRIQELLSQLGDG